MVQNQVLQLGYWENICFGNLLLKQILVAALATKENHLTNDKHCNLHCKYIDWSSAFLNIYTRKIDRPNEAGHFLQCAQFSTDPHKALQ